MYKLNNIIICYRYYTYSICKEKKNVFADLRKFKSGNHKKDWVHKSQIRKVSHLRNVRKSNKLFNSANLQICGLI
jgi:hypothetical protein